MDNLVSVIVPTKNESENIERCLKSIKNQAYKKIEIIVVDNFSKDNTVEIAKKFTDKVYKKGPERSAQRNYGARKAKGDFLLFVDADMELEKDLVVNCLSQHALSVVIPERIPGADFWSSCRNFEKSLYLNDNLVEAPRFISKSLFAGHNGYDSKLFAGEDLELSQKLQKNGVLPGHAKSYLLHHEKITLASLITKKFYYGKNLKNYARENFKTAIIYAFKPVLFKNYRKLLLHPLLALGMIGIKTLEFMAVCCGYIYSYIR